MIVLLVTYIVLRLKRGPVITPRSFLPHPSKKTASLRNLPSADIERGLRSRGTDRSGSLATTTRTAAAAAEKSSVRSGGRRPGPSSSHAHSHSHPHRKGAHPSSLAKEAGFQKTAGGGGSGRDWGRKGTTRELHTHADPHGPGKPLNTSRDLNQNHTVAVTMPVSAYATPHGRLRDPVRVPPYYPTVSPCGPPSPAVSRLTTSTRSSAALPSARFMPGMRKIDG